MHFRPLRDAGASSEARLYEKTIALGMVQMFSLKLQFDGSGKSPNFWTAVIY